MDKNTRGDVEDRDLLMANVDHIKIQKKDKCANLLNSEWFALKALERQEMVKNKQYVTIIREKTSPVIDVSMLG